MGSDRVVKKMAKALNRYYTLTQRAIEDMLSPGWEKVGPTISRKLLAELVRDGVIPTNDISIEMDSGEVERVIIGRADRLLLSGQPTPSQSLQQEAPTTTEYMLLVKVVVKTANEE